MDEAAAPLDGYIANPGTRRRRHQGMSRWSYGTREGTNPFCSIPVCDVDSDCPFQPLSKELDDVATARL